MTVCAPRSWPPRWIPRNYRALSFVQDTAYGVKIEEHTPWGLRLYLDKPVYGIAWNGAKALEQACAELDRHHSVLFVLDREIAVGDFRASLAHCGAVRSQDRGRWRRRGLVRAWSGGDAPVPGSAATSTGSH